MAKVFTDLNRKATLDTYYSAGLIAFLVSDPSNTIVAGSTMAQAAALEIASTNGYARDSVTVPASTGTSTATATVEQANFTASGGAMPSFTKICYCKGGNTTRGNATGTLEYIEDVPSSPITLADGQSFKHTLVLNYTATAA